MALRLRRHRFIFGAGRNPLVKTTMRSRIKWIRPICFRWFVTPVLVHPKPRRWIVSHVRFKRIPARLRDLLISTARGFDFRMKYYPIAPVWQRLGVRRNDRRAGLFV